MNNLEEMAENIRWLARADFFSPNVRFGAVSRKYRRKHLKQALDEESLFYFERCIPNVDYSVSTVTTGFNVCSEAGLVEYAEDVATCAPLIPMALIPVAFDRSGEPLLLDLESGQLWHFLTGRISGESLRVYSAQDNGFVKIPLTKETVFRMAEARFEGFCGLFRHAREATKNARVLAVWRCIDNEDIEYLEHVISLGLNLDVVNEEGRSPVQEAERQGKDELARILRRYSETDGR